MDYLGLQEEAGNVEAIVMRDQQAANTSSLSEKTVTSEAGECNNSKRNM